MMDFSAWKMDSLSAANGSFAIKLYKKLKENDKKCNLFFSPLSISSALAMVYLGAKGNTAAQMSKVLQFEKAKNVHSSFQSLITEINKPGTDYLLRTANRLYGEKSFAFLEVSLSFSRCNVNCLYSSVISDCPTLLLLLRTLTSGTPIRDRKIPEVLSQGSVNSTTKLVLVNALYFKCDWAEKFNAEQTTEAPFMLNKFSSYHFTLDDINTDPTKALTFIYIYTKCFAFCSLKRTFQLFCTFEKFQEWTHPDNMYPINVNVHLTKFKLEDSYKLKSVLSSLGMVDVFDASRADLLGMLRSKNLYLSEVVHKTFVEINEEGTEAAAVTAGIAMMCMLREEEFNANHPFLFFIRHNETKSLMFAGRYSSP
ncbi:leukocyte elastase inhibitor-like [Pyxicephalus adspersus]|uniref:leukocyte elastase inhibitor-like n=1 Tax=Pyxicephalus adspersus TaxID=30357 RepID=UPI003B58FD4A